MSENNPQTTTPAPESVHVTLEVPGKLYQDYSRMAEIGLYMSPEEALRHALVTSWRFDHGLFHSVRVDLTGDDEAKADKAKAEATPAAEA